MSIDHNVKISRQSTGGKNSAGGDFRALYFGEAAAEKEVAQAPQRFTETYLDLWNIGTKVLRERRFLLLGPKGSGKSAASAFLRLSWENELGPHVVFSRTFDFDQLNTTQTPLTSLDRKLVSDEVTSPTDSAWRLFIGARLLESLFQDPLCNLSRDPQALQFFHRLREVGLASEDYPSVLRQIRERRFSAGFAKLLGLDLLDSLGFNYEAGRRDGETLSPAQLGEAVLALVARAETPNRHLLAIDGLDKVITQNDSYWQTLAALIRVVNALT